MDCERCPRATDKSNPGSKGRVAERVAYLPCGKWDRAAPPPKWTIW